MSDATAKPLAVVTGASDGIGYELAKQFAQNGFDWLSQPKTPALSRPRALSKCGRRNMFFARTFAPRPNTRYSFARSASALWVFREQIERRKVAQA